MGFWEVARALRGFLLRGGAGDLVDSLPPKTSHLDYDRRFADHSRWRSDDAGGSLADQKSSFSAN